MRAAHARERKAKPPLKLGCEKPLKAPYACTRAAPCTWPSSPGGEAGTVVLHSEVWSESSAKPSVSASDRAGVPPEQDNKKHHGPRRRRRAPVETVMITEL